MAGISKTQRKAKAELEIRSAQAQRAMTTGLAKIVAKHIPEMLKSPNGSSFQIHGTITKDGGVDAVLSYQTTVVDRASFLLDDGRDELIPPEPIIVEPLPAPAGSEATQ